MTSRGMIGALVLLLLAGTMGWWIATGPARETPEARESARMAATGIDNFARVDDHLFRGAQPEARAFTALRNLGVDTIVKLNGDRMESETHEAQSLGLRFVSLPWNAHQLPTHEEVVTFLSLLRDHPDYHVFVHCKAGADRTGVMVALYRMEFDHWAPDRAVAEMEHYHYHPIFLPQLKRYVEGFPAAAAADPGLSGFAEPFAAITP